MAGEFKSHDELVKDNPNGLETLKTPHNFSSNPGFMSTAGMLGASTPAGGGVISGSSRKGVGSASPQPDPAKLRRWQGRVQSDRRPSAAGNRIQSGMIGQTQDHGAAPTKIHRVQTNRRPERRNSWSIATTDYWLTTAAPN